VAADKKMSASAAEKRLDRLTKSGVCFCENTSEHVKELKKMAEKTSDPEILDRQSRFFKALSDETRLKILGLLREREMCVCEIMVALDLTQPTASHHLRILEGAGLVQDEHKGKWVFYRVADPRLVRSVFEFDVK
jgi:DNA-binding transcriptional ArsR family regulator